MPRYAPNKMPAAVKRRYFELIRTGLSGSQAAKRVGVSLSCGSLWFIDAGRVSFIETPISPRYLSQDDRIEILTGSSAVSRSSRSRPGSGRATRACTGRSPATGKPNGRYQPWFAHNQACQWRQRPQAAPAVHRCRAARGRGRQAGQALVTGADQPVAAAPLPAPARLARLHRNAL
jgi:hypothetical protein